MLKGSWILKLSALVLALLTYLHVHRELYREESRTVDPSYRLIKLSTKKLAINARVGTSPPDGYEVKLDKITVQPSQITVIGPEALLDEASSADTAMIDISSNTKTTVKKIPVEAVAGINVAGEPYMVEVTIPIEKIPAASAKS